MSGSDEYRLLNRWTLVVLITLAVLFVLIVFATQTRAHPHEVTCEEVIESISKSATANRSVGYGHLYGPLDRRESLMWWSECGEFFIEHLIHGPPEGPLDFRGPITETHVIRVPREAFEGLPEITGRVLSEAEDCVISVP